jgi:hypothetical protein
LAHQTAITGYISAKDCRELSLEFVLCHGQPREVESFGKFRIREAQVKGSAAGEEVRLKPRNQTSVRFKFGAMVKVV